MSDMNLDELGRTYSAMSSAHEALSAAGAQFLKAANSFYYAATRYAATHHFEQPACESGESDQAVKAPVTLDYICFVCQKAIASGIAYSVDEATGRARHVVGSPLCRPWIAAPKVTASEEVDRLAVARAKLEAVFGELAKDGVEIYLPFKTVGGQEAWQQITSVMQLELRVAGSQEAPSI